jgi:hypothetical protein
VSVNIEKYPVTTEMGSYLAKVSKRETRSFFGIRYDCKVEVFVKKKKWYGRTIEQFVCGLDKGIFEYNSENVIDLIRQAIETYERDLRVSESLEGWDGDMR